MSNLTVRYSRFFYTPRTKLLSNAKDKMRPVARWLFVVFAAWVLSRSLVLLLADPVVPRPFPVPTARPRPAAAGSSMPPLSAFAILESNNIFALSSRAPVAPKAQPAPEQASKLNAFLLGTVAAPEPENARAIIQHEGVQTVLRPGQTAGGFTLVEVRRGSAVFEHAGQTIELKNDNGLNMPFSPVAIPAHQPVAGGGANAVSDPASSPPTQPAPPNQPAQAGAPPARDAGAGPPAAGQGNSLPLPAAVKILPEISKAIKRGALVPTADKNGFEVRQAAGNLLFKALKLQNGDILTNINGKHASIMADGKQLLREMESGLLTVEGRRGDGPLNIVLHLSGAGKK